MALSRMILILLAVILFVILAFLPLSVHRHFLWISVIFMIGTFLPFVIRFERRKAAGRELVLLAVLGAIAAVSRVPFAPLPSVQPTTFVVIVTGLAFGPESGFVVGALAALVSNMFLGQGPWTPWQMYAWGMIGLTAGLMRRTRLMKNTVGRCAYGFVVGILFGWGMNLMYVVSVMNHITWPQIVAYYSASFPFDLAHGLSNVFFLALFAKSWIKVLQRFQKKYGLLEQ
ncbi:MULTISPECIES: ECF transporter S component [Bacillus]|uniref:ECF transporter S component n=1 Tax=Bacillus TaxID=1386 RepID=UPI002E1DEACE|nr:ECF transporter S component [Bacillus smithii]MED4926525.1 ECF transporter S component [Bacillus smithii]